MNLRLLFLPLSCAATPLFSQAVTHAKGIEYSVLTIQRKGQAMPFGNATISAPSGKEVVEVKLSMKAVGNAACCKIGVLLLITTTGDTAHAVWGEMQAEGPITLDLPFIAPAGAKFRALLLDEVTILLTNLASEKPNPEPAPDARGSRPLPVCSG